MVFKAIPITFLVCLSLVSCEPPVGQFSSPINSFGTANYNTNLNNQDSSAPKSYEFGYQVKDDYTGNNYKRQEASDGNQVQGEYRVQLPDGRTQIVTYYADWQTGFHADVRYEGQASYPENFGGPQGFGGAPVPGFGGPQNVHHGPISSQYGTPSFGGLNLNNFNSPVTPATSSVSIKDYSGPGTPYNVGGYASGPAYNLGGQGAFDSYAPPANFGNKYRPSATYGAP